MLGVGVKKSSQVCSLVCFKDKNSLKRQLKSMTPPLPVAPPSLSSPPSPLPLGGFLCLFYESGHSLRLLNIKIKNTYYLPSCPYKPVWGGGQAVNRHVRKK